MKRSALAATAAAALLTLSFIPTAVRAADENEQPEPEAVATLTLHKALSGELSEEDLQPGDFQLLLNGEPVEQDSPQVLSPGNYRLAEEDTYGYTLQSTECKRWTGDETSEPVSVSLSGDVALDGGSSYDCTLTNSKDIGGQLTTVVRFQNRALQTLADKPVDVWVDCTKSDAPICVDDETPEELASSALSRLWNLLVPPVNAATMIPLTPGVPLQLGAGTFFVDHSSVGGYDVSFDGDCNAYGIVAVAEDDDQQCIITFTKQGGGGPIQKGTLRVVTKIVNDGGGSLLHDDIRVVVSGAGIISSLPGLDDPGAMLSMPAGPFNVISPFKIGYTHTNTGDCSGSLPPNATSVCTVTYDDESTVSPAPPAPPADPAPTADPDAGLPPDFPAPAPAVLGVTDTDPAPITVLPRTGGSILAVVLLLGSGLAALAAARRRA